VTIEAPLTRAEAIANQVLPGARDQSGVPPGRPAVVAGTWSCRGPSGGTSRVVVYKNVQELLARKRRRMSGGWRGPKSGDSVDPT